MKIIENIAAAVLFISATLFSPADAQSVFVSPVGVSTILYPDDSIVSQDGRFKLVFQQSDGNFVLYQGTTVLWATNITNGYGPYEGMTPSYTEFQSDGNLVVYFYLELTDSDWPIWASNSSPHYGATLAVQNDGNVVIYAYNNAVLWASNTCCH